MKQVAGWLKGLLGLVVLAVLILALMWLFRVAGQRSLTGQKAVSVPTPALNERDLTARALVEGMPVPTGTGPAEENLVSTTTVTPTYTAASTAVVAEQGVVRILYAVQPARGPVTLWTLDYDPAMDAVSTHEMSASPFGSAVSMRVYEVSVSPDGQYIALNLKNVQTGSEYGIWTAAIDGVWLLELMSLDRFYSPMFWDWMPGSKRMLVGGRDGEAAGTVSVEGGEFYDFALIPTEDYYHTVIDAAISPDGQNIVFSIGLESAIWFLPLDRNTLDLYGIKRFSPSGRSLNGVFSEHITWSPTGDKIAYFELLSGEMSEIQVMAVDTGQVSFLSSSDAHNIHPVWSRDGSAVLYIQETTPGIIGWDGGDPTRWNSSIWIGEVETGQYREVVSSEGKACWSADWLPDGSGIVFLSNRAGSSDVWVVNRDGSGLRRLTEQGNVVALDVMP